MDRAISMICAQLLTFMKSTPADVNYANDQNMQTWNVRFNLKQFFFVAKIFEFGVDV